VHAGSLVYDNNGIEDGSHGGFYDSSALSAPGPGLYRGYCMSNNYDFIYATYFRLAAATTFDTLIGYFDGDGFFGAFDPASPEISYRMNVWSAVQTGTAPGGGPIFMPACVGFRGDVLALDSDDGSFTTSYSGVDRIFPPSIPRPPDPLHRLKLELDAPVTLPAGDYFWSHDARVRGKIAIDLRPHNTHNQVNTGARQLVPIAILGAADFDPVAEVDLASVRVRGAEPLATKVSAEDVNDDLIVDLLLHFRARDFRKPSPAECADPDAMIRLEGGTTTGGSFAGDDHVDWTDPGC
jgi:hypothetical protein